MSDVYRILIQSGFDESGARKADEALANLEKRSKRVDDAGRKISEGFKLGLGLNLQGQVMNGLAQIPRMFGEALKTGVQFNAELESSRIGIAAIFKQFDDTGKLGNFQGAMEKAGEAIDLLRQKALESPATFQQLVSAYQGVAGAMASAGLNMRQQVDLVVTMSQALAGLGIRSEQILQESRALVTGNITEDAEAARILGITKKDVDTAREAGQLFEFLSGKLAAFKEAGKVGATTLNTQLSNLEDNLTNLKAVMAENVFVQIREAVVSLNQALGSDTAISKVAAWGQVIGSVFETIKRNWAIFIQFGDRVEKYFPADKLIPKLLSVGDYADYGELSGSAELAKRVELRGKRSSGLQADLRDARSPEEREKALAALNAEISAAKRERSDEIAKSTDGPNDAIRALSNYLTVLQVMKSHASELFGTGEQSLPKQAKATAEELKAVAKASTEIADAMGDIERTKFDALPDDSKIVALTSKVADARRNFEAYASEIVGIEISGRGDPDALSQTIQRDPNLAPDQKANLIRQLQQIVELEGKIGELNQKIDKDTEERLKKEKAEADARTQALAEMELQQNIIRAEVAGHTQLKVELEAQLVKMREKAALMSKHVPEAEAEKQAQITAELQRQKALKDQMDKQAKTASELHSEQAIREAQASGNKRAEMHAQAEKVGIETARKAREAGLPDWVERGRDAMESEEKRLRREARKSGERLKIGGGTERFADPTSNIGAVSSGFDTLKPLSTPSVGGSVTTSPVNAPAASPSSPSGGGAPGADALKDGGDKLQGAAGGYGAAVASINAAAAAIESSTKSLVSGLTNLAARVERLESYEGD
jgi:hypothetical protein